MARPGDKNTTGDRKKMNRRRNEASAGAVGKGVAAGARANAGGKAPFGGKGTRVNVRKSGGMSDVPE